jgi:ParB family chromosome partitioning protein
VTRPPIAQVAGASADRAALAEVARAMQDAEAEGRLVRRLPLEAIDGGHLVRDRLGLDEAEMAALEASLRARGQQTPVDVVDLGGGRYGLVSGWRRLEALRRIGAGTALAVVRRPDGAAAAYLAMVEENEIRAGLSFYERARIAAEAARMGLYADAAAAVAALFASAPAPRRSKTLAFVALHEALGPALRFPEAIPERLGLALAAAVRDAGAAARLRDALRKAAPRTAEAERAVLERAARKAPARREGGRGQGAEAVAPGIALSAGRGGGRLTLSGPGVTEALRRDLAAWLAARG